ncbi:MAG: BatA domain-containing protein [Aestuariibaculum sp.]
MQFKHPEFLYALFLLLIPIIVHLFQLRKFKKIAFTNVDFLKKVTLQTRKSSQIKKWLILTVRLLLFTAIILAFAQPYTANHNILNSKKETVIYLDNSFSMQAKGDTGELLKRAIQDLISHVPENENITLLTNNNTYKNTTTKVLNNTLLELDYTANTLSNKAALLKSNMLFSKGKHILKNLVFISDFQQQNDNFNIMADSLTTLHLVKLKPVNTNNVSIDSAFISNKNASAITLSVKLDYSGKSIGNLPVSLFNNDTLIAKTSVDMDKTITVDFSLPTDKIINGKISITDNQLLYDNDLFFNINKAPKINVLVISDTDISFLKRIYTTDEFNFLSSSLKQLDYNTIEKQNLIILNELTDIPTTLAVALKQFTNNGGGMVVVPHENSNTESYNSLLSYYSININAPIKAEKFITKINYTHPLYSNGVFEKQISNFQYPKVNNFYSLDKMGNAALSFEDGKPFLVQHNGTFVFSAALNDKNSNFKNAPLIVPTLYNIGKFSLKNPKLYYTIGKKNTFDVEVSLQQDDIITLSNGTENLIPKQQYFKNKVVVNTLETPNISGIYTIKDKTGNIKNISYNYDRNESTLAYIPLSEFKNIKISESVAQTFDSIKSNTKVNALWKWFVIFALVLLVTEMLILKYFK